MPSGFHNKQKSLKRRFLFILGVVTFVALLVLGLLLIFLDNFPPRLDPTQKKLFGGFVLVYAVLRFSRYLKRKPDNEE
jgi:prolipoprotein diacylglyceryltransferase